MSFKSPVEATQAISAFKLFELTRECTSGETPSFTSAATSIAARKVAFFEISLTRDTISMKLKLGNSEIYKSFYTTNDDFTAQNSSVNFTFIF